MKHANLCTLFTQRSDHVLLCLVWTQSTHATNLRGCVWEAVKTRMTVLKRQKKQTQRYADHEALPLKILQLVLLKTKRLTNIIITQYLHQEILHGYKFSNIQSTFRYPQYLYGILFSLEIFFFFFFSSKDTMKDLE